MSNLSGEGENEPLSILSPNYSAYSPRDFIWISSWIVRIGPREFHEIEDIEEWSGITTIITASGEHMPSSRQARVSKLGWARRIWVDSQHAF